ncbi:branched-chain amino acid ABC transporter permease [Chelatococcus reniformis]|uniref:Branched-chain amino acid ABC transporter permease n=1 Tax=Chelatococcus reniformis TaxID=1494448 RepID=A0A916XLL4_9HYPH|nr:branched-chain amino acid ABC transporter permease [Chelatococcus reniformis]GGC81507.1 branched-chain amino acid ABC transporter permease [Chelatococcus reniformis]
MELLLQTIVNGVVLGAGYAVVAVGLTLIFGIVGIANFAHGAYFAIGAYGCYLLTGQGLSYFLAVPVAVLIVAGIGVITELAIVRRSLYGDAHHGSLIVMFALGQAIIAALILLFGPDPHPVPSPLGQTTFNVFGILVTAQRAFIFGCSMVVLAAFGLWLGFTVKGQQIVAVAQNARGALYSGINVPMIRTLAFVLGVAAAGLAGALLAPIVTAYPTMGHGALIVGFTVVILGGMGSISGALLGALLMGVANALFETYVSVSWTPALGWILVIATLLLWPQGLRGRAQLHRH